MDRDRIDAALLVLAGGRSSRMGESKAFLKVGEASLLGWMLDRLAPHFEQAMVSVAGREAARPTDLGAAEIVYDLHRDRGPLSGIEAGLAASRFDAVFVVACDMPAVTAELAATPVAASEGHDAAVPLLPGGPEPLCAAYRLSAAAEIGIAIRDDRLQVRAALAGLDAVYLESLDPGLFRNLNSQDDYREFLGTLP